jgi:hypothetical protein
VPPGFSHSIVFNFVFPACPYSKFKIEPKHLQELVMVAHSDVYRFIVIITFVLWVNVFLPEVRAEPELKLSAEILSGNTIPHMNTSIVPVQGYSPTISIRVQNQSGLKKLKATGELRIRGWEVKDDFYIGHTKVGDRWGLGILIERDDYVYGINHRGIQVLKRF